MGQNLQDRENLQHSSSFFWKAKPVRAVKWRNQTLVKCCLSQMAAGFELLKKKIQKKYFHGLFWWIFWEIFSLYWKTRQLEHWKSPFIWHIWIFCCILRKRAWSELFKTPPTWFNPIILIWMLIIRSWEVFRKCENLKIHQLRTAGNHAKLIRII